MPRRGSNIYKRKDGRFEGRVAIGHKEMVRCGTSMYMLTRFRN